MHPCVSIWLGPFTVHLKLSQYCSLVIHQNKIKSFKKKAPSSAGSGALIPGQGNKLPFASGSKNANENNRSNIVAHSIQTLKIIYIKREIIVFY